MSRENDLRLLVFTELREAEEKSKDENLDDRRRSEYQDVRRVLWKLVKMSGFLYDYLDWRKKI